MTFAEKNSAVKSTVEGYIQNLNAEKDQNLSSLDETSIFLIADTAALDTIYTLFTACEKFTDKYRENKRKEYAVPKIICAVLLFFCTVLVFSGAGVIIFGKLHPLLNWMWGILLICSSIGLFQLVLVVAVFAKTQTNRVFSKQEQKFVVKNKKALQLFRTLQIPKTFYHSTDIELLKQAQRKSEKLNWSSLQKEAKGRETERICKEREKNRAFLGKVYYYWTE